MYITMANTKCCVESKIIKEIFHTMDYGVSKITVQKAKEWFVKHNHKFNPLVTENLKYVKVKNFEYDQDIYISKLSEELAQLFIEKLKDDKLEDIEHIKRARILRTISKNIQKNIDLLCEVNLIMKGITSKTTQKVDIPIIVDYLEYYASITYLTSFKHYEWSPYDRVLVVLPEDNALCLLAIAFAPAFAAGCKINFLAEGNLTPLAFLFRDICLDAGVPEDHLRVICTDEQYSAGQIILQKDPIFDKVTYFGKLDAAKTLKYGLSGYSCDLSLLISSKCSMVVHKDADIYSACDAIVDAAWSYIGQLSWNLYTVYVDESIGEKFLDTLKKRMDKVVIGSLQNKITDVGIDNKFNEQIHQLKIKASSLGIEIYESTVKGGINEDLKLMLINGIQITDDDDFTPAITILPYRNTTELINLINNTRYGLATSIWSENESFIKELQKNIQTSLIWINCYGTISAQIPLCPYKESGIGYFGGKKGLFTYMYLDGNKLQPHLKFHNHDQTNFEINQEACNKVEKAKKALNIWSQWSILAKCSAIQRLGDTIEKSEKIPEEKKRWWVHIIYEYSTKYLSSETGTFENKIAVTTLKEPLGIIVIDAIDFDIIPQLISFAILNGNVVILVTENAGFLTEISKLMEECKIPNNVLSIITTKQYLKSLADHENVQSYWYEMCYDTNSVRYNRARHIEWRATYNLKNTYIFESKHKFDYLNLDMLSSKTKSIISYPGESFNC